MKLATSKPSRLGVWTSMKLKMDVDRWELDILATAVAVSFVWTPPQRLLEVDKQR